MSKRIVSVILGGGAGTRLQPLTRDRSKPAVPLAGKYRLVDIPISNCLNSDIKKIFLLTQFNSVSLHDHIHDAFRFDMFESSFVRILAAQQTPGAQTWYNGTADAVRQTFQHFMNEEPDLVIILSGDQLYQMDFKKVIRFHLEKEAEVTIAAKPVTRQEAGALGIMQINTDERIQTFHEKPGDTEALTHLKVPGVDREEYLASMGIYVFNASILKELLDQGDSDFGKHIIPLAIETRKVYSYRFDKYWQDIGTLGAFWDANIQLTQTVPNFSFYDAKRPIYTRSRFLPPSKLINCTIDHGIVTEGCIIDGAFIKDSIVGIRAKVGKNTHIQESYVMGSDYYEEERKKGDIPLGIGDNCHIYKAIIDKNARIGSNVKISPEGKPDGTETDLYTVRDGVIVIPKNTVIESGTEI